MSFQQILTRWCVIATVVLFSSSLGAVQINNATGPIQENTGCGAETREFCNLRIYQVMVEAFVDGDPARDYTDGYGTSHHNGDLRGIIDSLEYIRNLGMNAIWLTPVFDSGAGEPQVRLSGSGTDLKLDATGYFTRNYFAIDPKFGSLEDARELVDTAHAKGLYVFFDGVFGHHKGGLVSSPTGKLPVDSTDPNDYFGNPSGYPGRVVDYDSPQTLEFYKEVAAYWVRELGIDGWRLDQAYQVPLSAWREIKTAVEVASAERRIAGKQWGTLAYMVAEIFAGADDIAAQAFGQEQAPALDSGFDFPLRWAAVGVLAAEESGLGRRPASTLNESWAYGAHTSTYRPLALPNMMLGNHDFVRFGDLLQRAGIADPQDAEYWARHRLAFMLQGAYSGPVTRYYGEEIGDELPGFAGKVFNNCAEFGLCDDHVARTSAKILNVSVSGQELSSEQHALLQFHRDVMNLRRSHPALSHGSRQHLYSDNNLYIDLKSDGDQQLVFAMNVSPEARDVDISDQLFASPDIDAIDLLSLEKMNTDTGYLSFTLEPLSGRFILMTSPGLPKMNAGLNDAWYNPGTSGQGFFITVFPDIGFVSLAWFTYDTSAPADSATAKLGDPGHRWVTAIGSIEGTRSVMDITISSGGLFDSATQVQRTDPPGSDGTITLNFQNCNSATIDYDIPSIDRQGSMQIKRVANDNIALCEVLSGR